MLKRLRRRSTGMAFLTAMLLMFCVKPALADINVTYQVHHMQSSARDVLQYVNALRRAGSWYWNQGNTSKTTTGSMSALTYDYALEKAAIKRAEELALYYDHTRPNGQSYSTAYTANAATSAENIAAGYATASAVFEGWLEENEPYEKQGHRRAMLQAQYTAIGIGHVECAGKHYWAMELNRVVTSPNQQTAAAEGIENVTVSASGSYLSGVELSPISIGQMLIGDSEILSPTLFLKGRYANNWQSRVPVSATFNLTVGNSALLRADGLRLTALKDGQTEVKVTASSAYGTDSVSFSVQINKIDLSDAEISLAEKEYVWNGEPVCPKPTISYRGSVLEEGTDYRLVYVRNGKCTRNTGGANVSAIGLGNYTGMLAETFEIVPADLSSLQVSLEQTEFVADGYTKEPGVIIDGLTEGDDYRVEYFNNRYAGTARVQVSGIGNYKGTVNLTFTIKSAGNQQAVNGGSGNSGSGGYDSWSNLWSYYGIQNTQYVIKRTVTPVKPVILSAVNKKKKKVILSWTSQAGVDGYEIRYITGKKQKTVTVTSAYATVRTLSKLKKGKKYTITVRSFVRNGNSVQYSSWSKKKKVKIRK